MARTFLKLCIYVNDCYLHIELYKVFSLLCTFNSVTPKSFFGHIAVDKSAVHLSGTEGPPLWF